MTDDLPKGKPIEPLPAAEALSWPCPDKILIRLDDRMLSVVEMLIELQEIRQRLPRCSQCNSPMWVEIEGLCLRCHDPLPSPPG